MRYYFSLQCRILNRQLIDFGIQPFIGYVLGSLLFIGLTAYLFRVTEYAPWLYAILGLSTVSMLSDTGRVQFLRQHCPNREYYRIRLVENLLVSLPFVVGLCLYNEWIIGLTVFGLALLMSLSSINGPSGLVIPTPFSKFPFEFTIGFRKNILLLIGALILLIISIIYHNANLGLFSVGFVLLTCLLFYFSSEPVYYVWIYKMTPATLLKHKILIAVKFASLLFIPYAIVYVLFFSDHVWYVLLVYILGLLYIVTTLLGKYAFFPSAMNLPQGLLMAFSFWFPPLLLFLIPYFYRRSIHQLNPILI